MPPIFKVHELLSRAELDQLEAYAREPGRTVDECWIWLTVDHSFNISRGSVGRWKREFDVTDRFTASNETAKALVDAAKAGGTVAITDAANLQLSQMIFEQLVKLQSGGEIETKELWAVSMAIKNTVGAAGGIEKLKGEMAAKFDVEMKAKTAKRGTITADDIAEARKAIFGQ